MGRENGGVGYGVTNIINYSRQTNVSFLTGKDASVNPIIVNGSVVNVVISNSGGDSFAFLPSKNGGIGGFGYVAQTGQKYGYSNCVPGNSNQNYGASYGQGDVIKIEFDTDNKTLTFYKNNVSQGIAYTSGCFSGTTFHFAITICNTNFTVTKD